MTVEIIRAGKLPEETKLKYTCKNCKTIFTFLISDAIEKHYPVEQRDSYSYKINCPRCKKACFVPDISFYRCD